LEVHRDSSNGEKAPRSPVLEEKPLLGKKPGKKGNANKEWREGRDFLLTGIMRLERGGGKSRTNTIKGTVSNESRPVPRKTRKPKMLGKKPSRKAHEKIKKTPKIQPQKTRSRAQVRRRKKPLRRKKGIKKKKTSARGGKGTKKKKKKKTKNPHNKHPKKRQPQPKTSLPQKVGSGKRSLGGGALLVVGERAAQGGRSIQKGFE